MPFTIPEASADPAFVIKYKGVIDYDGLTTFLITWLDKRGFDINEELHKHKASGAGFEIERNIKGELNVDEFFLHKVNFNMHIWDAFVVDAVKKGQKVKLWNCRIDLKLGCSVVCDYRGKWSTSPFMDKLLKFYCSYIIKKEIIIKQMDPLYKKLLVLHNDVKSLFDMGGKV